MTNRKRGAKNSPEARWRALRSLRITALCCMIISPLMIAYGAFCLRRDRPSLQWPTVPGTMMQVDLRKHYGRHSISVHVIVTYVYKVNGVRYVSHQICGGGGYDLDRMEPADNFANAHPVRSTIEVHYDPHNPANAVLVPGADEFLDQLFIYGGAVNLILTAWLLFRTRKEYAGLTAQRPKAKPTAPARSSKEALSSEPFLTYEPGCKRKLNAFPDRDCVVDMLGQGKSIQVWKPDDRIIDVSGRLYRIISHDNNKRYEMEPTGETWDWTRLLDLATSDAKVIKKDPRSIERRVAEAPNEGRIATIMQCVNELPAAPRWFWVAFGLFLLLFFLAVMFGVGYLLRWLGMLGK